MVYRDPEHLSTASLTGSFSGVDDGANESTPLVSDESNDDFVKEAKTVELGVDIPSPPPHPETISRAAYLVRDAVLGEAAHDNPSLGAYHVNHVSGGGHGESESTSSLRNRIFLICRSVLATAASFRIPLGIGVILILLSFLEPPVWCRNQISEGGCEALLKLEGIPVDNSTNAFVQYYPNTSSMILSSPQSHRIEAACLAVLVLWTLIRVGGDGSSFKVYFRRGPSLVNRILQLLCLTLLIIGLGTGMTVHHPFVRLVLVITLLPTVQRDVKIMWSMMPEIYNILLLLVIFICFYAWMGAVLFVDTDEGRLHFPNFLESAWSLYICVTTANYPDIMMASYNENRWSALYFVSFMILNFFFFLNVILAHIVLGYETNMGERRKYERNEAENKLRSAFDLLKDPVTNRIGRETTLLLFQVLNDQFGDSDFRDSLWNEKERSLVFAVFDRDGSSTITKSEFLSVADVLSLELVQESSYQSFVEKFLPSLYQSNSYQYFESIVRSPRFDAAVDIILVLNAVLVAIQSFPELFGTPMHSSEQLLLQDGSIDTVWEVGETIFTVLYVIECGCKLIVFGHRSYFEQPKNVFDFSITTLAVICSMLVYIPNKINDSRIIRMVVMARVLRLIRVLTSSKRFQMIGSISAEILPRAKSVLLVLFFLCYFFASIAVQLYGGMITRDPLNPLSKLILATDFSDNDYWANNFNDMISAMNVLFNLLVINNWTECEIGFEAVTQSKLVRWFFVAFHILGVILVNNLVIAVIINSFMNQLTLFKERDDQEALVVDDGHAVIHAARRRVNFDAGLVTGTKTSIRGGYIAHYRRTGSSLPDDTINESERLRRLFTQTK